jgi:hypothetical protein
MTGHAFPALSYIKIAFRIARGNVGSPKPGP